MTKSFLRSASVIALSVMAAGFSASAVAAAPGKAPATAVTVNTQTTTQTGNSNAITISQVGATKEEAKILQNGNSNTATVTQSGQGDLAFSQVVGNSNTVTQTFGAQAGGTLTNNNSQVYQCVTAACNSAATVKPTGNAATTTLTGTNQASYIVQAGNNNTATTTLSGDGGVGAAANAQIEQYTDYNTAEITQTGTTAGLVKVIQGVTTATATRNVAYSGAYTVSTAPAAQLGTSPLGANNSATVTQDAMATDGVVNIYQGADFNLATAIQQGSDQFVEIRQDGATATDSYGNNNAKVTQELSGTGADAFVVQNGQSNKITLTQSALNVTADLAQYGNLNKLTLTQGTAGASATLTQTGNSNTLTMSQ
ncbi:hypothetical protein AB5I39_01445 [Sphingomonas sp. MMS24-J45]|uniref:hypothetical protein n=1 Tax=Sphingomonas sp. MMS24-J45 TaxID=3238806 RepID=UPI00384B7BC9